MYMENMPDSCCDELFTRHSSFRVFEFLCVIRKLEVFISQKTMEKTLSCIPGHVFIVFICVIGKKRRYAFCKLSRAISSFTF